MLRANFHTHTVFCDGTNTAEEMVQQALALGFEQLGFSGHMDPDIHMDWPAYVAEITRLKRAYAGQLDILMGVELDNVYDPACCPGAEFVIGSTHFLDVETPTPMSVDNSPEIMEQLCREYYGGDWLARHLAACGGTVRTGDQALARHIADYTRRALAQLED